jgi:hypothetical protein
MRVDKKISKHTSLKKKITGSDPKKPSLQTTRTQQPISTLAAS